MLILCHHIDYYSYAGFVFNTDNSKTAHFPKNLEIVKPYDSINLKGSHNIPLVYSYVHASVFKNDIELTLETNKRKHT